MFSSNYGGLEVKLFQYNIRACSHPFCADRCRENNFETFGATRRTVGKNSTWFSRRWYSNKNIIAFANWCRPNSDPVKSCYWLRENRFHQRTFALLREGRTDHLIVKLRLTGTIGKAWVEQSFPTSKENQVWRWFHFTYVKVQHRNNSHPPTTLIQRNIGFTRPWNRGALISNHLLRLKYYHDKS